MSVNVDDVIQAYIKLRDDTDALEKRHKEELKPLRDKMSKCELWLQNQLQLAGLQSFKSDKGTAFFQEVQTVSVPGWEDTKKFIQEKDMWDLLDRRVSKSAVLDYIETYGEVPPGVNVVRTKLVRVRRG